MAAIATTVSAQNITRLEYSIDGFVAEGKGTAIDISGDSNELDTDFNIDISSLDPGNHTIHFRAMNENDVWSFAAERSFYIPESPVTEGIVAMEYSIDEFVKEGEGEMITLSNGTNDLDSTLLFDIAGMEPGIHNIYMRAKNKLGVWSLPAQRSFVISKPDTAKIENIFYRIYNDNFESTWMTALVDPARKNVDSTIMASVAGLNLDDNYTIEFYAQNNRAVRGFSAYLSNVNLMMNHSPERKKDLLDISVSVNQVMELSMDSLFTDEDLNFGDSLAYAITNADNVDIFDFTDWETHSLLSFSPISGYSGNYNFWLKTSDLAGESDSVQVMLTVTGVTGISDKEAAASNFLIYPNPANDFVKIKVVNSQIEAFTLNLLSATGKLVYSKNYQTDELEMNLHEIPRGMYFIVLQSKGLIVSKKLIRK